MPEGRERGEGGICGENDLPRQLELTTKASGEGEGEKKGELPSPLPPYTLPILRYLHKQLLFPTVWEEEGGGR